MERTHVIATTARTLEGTPIGVPSTQKDPECETLEIVTTVLAASAARWSSMGLETRRKGRSLFQFFVAPLVHCKVSPIPTQSSAEVL